MKKLEEKPSLASLINFFIENKLFECEGLWKKNAEEKCESPSQNGKIFTP